jgi:hypothetical protein
MVCAPENYHRLVHVPPRVPVPEEKGTIDACAQRLLSPKIPGIRLMRVPGVQEQG